MITKAVTYQSSDGSFHPSLEAAQIQELYILLGTMNGSVNIAPGDLGVIAKDMIKASGNFIDILTMKPNSLPKARKINGGTKRRKPATPEPSLPLEAK